MINNTVSRKMLIEKSSISSAVAMEICVIRISHGIHNRHNHLVLYNVRDRLLLILLKLVTLSKNVLIISCDVSELEPVPNTEQQVLTLVLSISIPMLVLFVFISGIFFFYRRRKLGYFNEVNNLHFNMYN